MRAKGASYLVHVAGIGLGMILMAPWGCGVKSSPKPPERIIPGRVDDLKAVAKGKEIVLGWSVPDTNTNGSPLLDLDGFEVLKAKGGKCPKCPPKFVLIADIKYLYPEGATSATGRMEYMDKEVECGSYTYKVRAYNKKGHKSSDSKRAFIAIYMPADPPTGLRAVAGNKRVELGWDHPMYAVEAGEDFTNLVGYNVYQGKASKKYGRVPKNKEPIATNHFLDLKVLNNRRYFYALRAVRKIDDRLCEGSLSNEVSALPKDLTPPSPPEGIACEQVAEGVLLYWWKNTEPDLKGYNVYRKTEDSIDYERLTPTPMKETTFVDRQISPDTWYFYKVTAVDNAPSANESHSFVECLIRYSNEGFECPEGVQCPSE